VRIGNADFFAGNPPRWSAGEYCERGIFMIGGIQVRISHQVA
jgi:hypothetical protein